MIRCVAFSGSARHIVAAGDAGYRVFRLPGLQEDTRRRWAGAGAVSLVAVDAQCHTLLLVGRATPRGGAISDRKAALWSHRFGALEGDVLFGRAVASGALTRDHAVFLLDAPAQHEPALLFVYPRPLGGASGFGCFLAASASPLRVIEPESPLAPGGAVVLFAAPPDVRAVAEPARGSAGPGFAGLVSNVAQISQGVAGLALAPHAGVAAAALARGVVGAAQLSRGVFGLAQQCYARAFAQLRPPRAEACLGVLGVLHLRARESPRRARGGLGASIVAMPLLTSEADAGPNWVGAASNWVGAGGGRPVALLAHRRPLAAVAGARAARGGFNVAATASTLGTLVRIWNVDASMRMCELRHKWQPAEVRQLAFSDSAHLALLASSGELHGWPLGRMLAAPPEGGDACEEESDGGGADGAQRPSALARWLPGAGTRLGALLRRALPVEPDAPLAAASVSIPAADGGAAERPAPQPAHVEARPPNEEAARMVVSDSVDDSSDESPPERADRDEEVRGGWIKLKLHGLAEPDPRASELDGARVPPSRLCAFAFIDRSAPGGGSVLARDQRVLAVTAAGGVASWCLASLSPSASPPILGSGRLVLESAGPCSAGADGCASADGGSPLREPERASPESAPRESAEDCSPLRASALARAFGLGDASYCSGADATVESLIAALEVEDAMNV